MNEKKNSVDKLLHLINNDMSLIVGVPTYTYAHIFAQFSAPALDDMSAPGGYGFLKLFLLLILIWKSGQTYKIIILSSALKTYVNFQIYLTSISRRKLRLKIPLHTGQANKSVLKKNPGCRRLQQEWENGELATWNGSTERGGERKLIYLGTERCENIKNK